MVVLVLSFLIFSKTCFCFTLQLHSTKVFPLKMLLGGTKQTGLMYLARETYRTQSLYQFPALGLSCDIPYCSLSLAKGKRTTLLWFC